MSAINIKDSLFVDDEGLIYPVVQWIDEYGQDCSNSDFPVAAVAGAKKVWYSIDLKEYTGPIS